MTMTTSSKPIMAASRKWTVILVFVTLLAVTTASNVLPRCRQSGDCTITVAETTRNPKQVVLNVHAPDTGTPASVVWTVTDFFGNYTDKTVVYNDRVHLCDSQTSPNLCIESLEPGDEGRYTCTYQFDGASVSTTTNICLHVLGSAEYADNTAEVEVTSSGPNAVLDTRITYVNGGDCNGTEETLRFQLRQNGCSDNDGLPFSCVEPNCNSKNGIQVLGEEGGEQYNFQLKLTNFPMSDQIVEYCSRVDITSATDGDFSVTKKFNVNYGEIMGPTSTVSDAAPEPATTEPGNIMATASTSDQGTTSSPTNSSPTSSPEPTGTMPSPDGVSGNQLIIVPIVAVLGAVLVVGVIVAVVGIVAWFVLKSQCQQLSKICSVDNFGGKHKVDIEGGFKQPDIETQKGAYTPSSPVTEEDFKELAKEGEERLSCVLADEEANKLLSGPVSVSDPHDI